MLFDNSNMLLFNDFGDTFLEDPDEGFLKGNMFKNEYKPYKRLTYFKPKLDNEKERELYALMRESFRINDYNLYLDLHPEDTKVFNAYKESCQKLKNLKETYEKKYNEQLCVTENEFNKFEWTKSPWPWDKKDGKYV